MPEGIDPGWLLAAALAAGVAGMGWLALAMPAHAQQVWGRVPLPATARSLRILGALGLLASLVLCLAVDHPTMAALVWVMLLAAAALAVAFALSWKARWLGLLAPWVRPRRGAASRR